MVLSRTYLAILAAFAVGVIGAIGFSVHAQTAVPTSTAVQAAVSAPATQVSDGDGEQADDAATAQSQDQSGTDVETDDDGTASAQAATDTQETESASDVGEVEDGQ
jgi:hypothetical protein